MLMWLASFLLVLGGVFLAMAASRPQTAVYAQRYAPYYTEEQWAEIEPHFVRAFEGFW